MAKIKRRDAAWKNDGRETFRAAKRETSSRLYWPTVKKTRFRRVSEASRSDKAKQIRRRAVFIRRLDDASRTTRKNAGTRRFRSVPNVQGPI
jgi:hypothetical protein